MTAAGDLRVISIGIDPTIALADPSKGSRGDSRRRQEEYASLVASYTAIVKTPNSTLYHEHRWGRHAILPTQSSRRWLFPLDAYRLAAGICRTQGADMVITQDPFFTGAAGYALKRRFGVPLCIQIHSDNIGSEWWLRESPRNRLMESAGKWLVRRADSIQVVSNTIAGRLVKNGVAPERIWNIMPAGGIDAALYRDADGSKIRARLLGERHNRLVLFVGRLVAVKDLPTLLDAASIVVKELPDTLFVLIGDGEERAKGEELLHQKQLQGNVALMGGTSADEMPGYFAACDVFTMSSLYEGKARTLVEAACAGKPIVTTDVSGADEVVAHGETGFIVPVRDSKALAGRVIQLLRNPELAQEMGRRGQEIAAEAYDRQQHLNKIAEMWEATARCRTTAARMGR
jgi:glycosyltransferase involved in cell wall biosynthesis